jgi:hypothetical protein
MEAKASGPYNRSRYLFAWAGENFCDSEILLIVDNNGIKLTVITQGTFLLGPVHIRQVE